MKILLISTSLLFTLKSKKMNSMLMASFMIVMMTLNININKHIKFTSIISLILLMSSMVMLTSFIMITNLNSPNFMFKPMTTMLIMNPIINIKKPKYMKEMWNYKSVSWNKLIMMIILIMIMLLTMNKLMTKKHKLMKM